MSLHVLANHMASKGRGGDSMLVHMTPGEVQGLQALAFKMGGSLTINPETGLPEANFLKKMLPILAGAALNFFAPGIGTAIGAAFGASGAVGTGLLVGGVTGLATGSLSKGLMAGLGAYGGAGLGEAFAGAGSQAIASSAAVPEVGGAAVREAGIAAANEGIASSTPWEKLGSGFNAVTKDPAAMWDFAKANKGPLAAAGMSYMAGQEPAKLEIPTTTQVAQIRPLHKTQERIRPGDPDYRTNEAGSQIGYFRTNYTVPEPYPAAASGGIVALADGGMTDEQLSSIGTYLATNPSASDLSAAMQQFGVSQADVDRARSQMAPAQAAPANAFTQAQSGNTVIPGAGEWWTTPEGGERYRQQQMEDYQKGVDSSNAFLKLRQATGQENTPFFSGTGSLSSGADSAAYLPAMYEQYGIEIPELAKEAYQQATGQAFQSGTTPTGFNAQSGQYTIGGAELPQATQTGPTRMEQMAQAGQGVQWGSGQSEAGVIEQMRSQGWSPEYMAQAMGVPVDTISGAINRYDLGVGRDKELALKRAAGIDVSSSPYGGFSPARQIAENERNEGIRAGTIPAPAPTPTAAPSPFTVGGAQAAAPSGIETLSAQSTGQDLSGTVAGAFVGPRNTVITYDSTGKQTDTGRPASALNDYLTNPQESGVGAFVRGLSWGVSPEEDAKSSKKLYDFAKARGMNGSELIKQAGLEGSGITGQGLDAQWAQWNVQPIKPVDPYNPGTPIVAPPPAKAPIAAPSVPVNAPKPPGWTGITRTDIPPKATPEGGISALTTLTGDPYGLTPTAAKFTPPTRTGRSKEIYDYLSGKTATAPPSTRVRSEAKAPAPAPGSTESAAPKDPDPTRQPTINNIYDFIHTLNWGNPEVDAVSAPKLSAEAAKKGWSIEQLSTASGFSVAALNAMFEKYGVSTPPPEAKGPPVDTGVGGYATGGYLGMAGGGLGSLGGYSDGGQLLRGPGDGVSDDIPAIIGDRQPARLASGEFVVPARIVSELGNGSTEAGARSLYRMMDRVQAGRKKSIGKGKVAVNSRAENYLPA